MTGPKTATVAELDNIFDIPVVIKITNKSLTNGTEEIISPKPYKILSESHVAAPVNRMLVPKEIVEPKRIITPQCVFLFKSLHFTNPPTK